MNGMKDEGLTVEEVRKTYVDRDGVEQHYWTQATTIEVEVGGVKRSVRAERFSADHVWHAREDAVVVRFPTGSKEHLATASLVRRSNGRWEAVVHGFRNRNTCYVVRWATAADAETRGDEGSGWNRRRGRKKPVAHEG